MPSNLRSKIQSGPLKRSCVSVAAIGSSHSGKAIVSVLRSSIISLAPLLGRRSVGMDTATGRNERGNLRRAVLLGDVQRRPAVAGQNVRIRPAVEKHACSLGPLQPGRRMQRRAERNIEGVGPRVDDGGILGDT